LGALTEDLLMNVEKWTQINSLALKNIVSTQVLFLNGSCCMHFGNYLKIKIKKKKKWCEGKLI